MSRIAVAAGLVFALSAAGASAQEMLPPGFAGPWGRHAFNFEPMPTGPQPLVNLNRNPDGTNNLGTLVGDYRNPILKPEASAVVRQHGEMSLSGHAYPDPSNQCRPYAPPFTLAMQLGFQMLPDQNGITVIYNQDDQVRHIRMNSTHPAKIIPSAMGDSIGHMDGDTLVVDTVGIETGPLTMVDRWGTPHSDALHVVERYRLIDGAAAKAAMDQWEKTDGQAGLAGTVLDSDLSRKGMQVEVSVEDPAVFTTPWKAHVTYRHAIRQWQEQVCAENPADYYPGMSSEFPRAVHPES